MERLFLIPQPETLTNKLKHIRCCSSVKPTKDICTEDDQENIAEEFIDRFCIDNHQLQRVCIELTYRCNEKCKHCYVADEEKNEQQELTYEQYVKILDDLRRMNVLHVTFTGGEVAVRNDFVQIVEYAIGLGFAVEIYSNGIGFTEDILEALDRLHPRSVSFSLYSGNEEEHDALTQVKGSFRRTLYSLMRLKCAGIFVKIEDLLQQKSKKPNNSLGIYYVWLSQSLPVFGGVERIKELRRWTSSQKFKEDYPMLFFNAAIDRGEKGDSATSRRLIDLHQRVYAGDVDAAVLLADTYLSGNSEMGNSMSAALWLYQQAAFGGSAKAMHVLATAMKSEIGGFKAQERTINRLYHCAASRGFSPSKRKLGANDVINADMPRTIQQRIHQYLPYCHCSVECVFGTPNTPELDDVRNGFWMDGDDDIYALDITRSIEGNYLGVAISRKGIFGRVSDKDWPYGITWQEFISSEFYQQELSQGNWLVSGTQPLYRVTNKLKGTIGELLIRLLGTKN